MSYSRTRQTGRGIGDCDRRLELRMALCSRALWRSLRAATCQYARIRVASQMRMGAKLICSLSRLQELSDTHQLIFLFFRLHNSLKLQYLRIGRTNHGRVDRRHGLTSALAFYRLTLSGSKREKATESNEAELAKLVGRLYS